MDSATLSAQQRSCFLAANTSWATGTRVWTRRPFSGGRSATSRTSRRALRSSRARRLSSVMGVTSGFRSQLRRGFGRSTNEAEDEEAENECLSSAMEGVAEGLETTKRPQEHGGDRSCGANVEFAGVSAA
ncbi:hypothetical protein ACMD2_06692 [Ananas comosus]|uniref:Uncharacterized protein n=1 Tax=Ananas comosus TaxID=4615 RepID=A0A199URS2_ANACO|nr:hypothetical protein ACMD2_06692 [Ananas comosus]